MRLRFLWVLFSIALVAVWAGCRAEETRKDILGTEIKRYSQWNEELIIRDFFQDERGGVFLDVGCAWPVRKSTTFYLEKHLGWSGIAIDALDIYRPGWAAVRPRSEFLAYAVTDHSGDKVTFYQHASAPVLSSLSKEQAALMGGEESLTTVEVETTTLNDVLDARGVTRIDHMTLDIEGAEPAALAGFDIERFRPRLVVVEAGWLYEEYFESHGYELIEEYIEHDKVNRYFRPVP